MSATSRNLMGVEIKPKLIRCPVCRTLVDCEVRQHDQGFKMPRHGKTMEIKCSAGDKQYLIRKKPLAVARNEQ